MLDELAGPVGTCRRVRARLHRRDGGRGPAHGGDGVEGVVERGGRALQRRRMRCAPGWAPLAQLDADVLDRALAVRDGAAALPPEKRDWEIGRAFIAAAEPPLKIARVAVDVAELAEAVARCGRAAGASQDAVAAATLAAAAARGRRDDRGGQPDGGRGRRPDHRGGRPWRTPPSTPPPALKPRCSWRAERRETVPPRLAGRRDAASSVAPIETPLSRLPAFLPRGRPIEPCRRAPFRQKPSWSRRIAEFGSALAGHGDLGDRPPPLCRTECNCTRWSVRPSCEERSRQACGCRLPERPPSVSRGSGCWVKTTAVGRRIHELVHPSTGRRRLERAVPRDPRADPPRRPAGWSPCAISGRDPVGRAVGSLDRAVSPGARSRPLCPRSADVPHRVGINNLTFRQR